MSRRSKRKAEASGQTPASPSPPMGGYQVFDLQVFDGKGHPSTVSYMRDGGGRERYRLRRARDFKANLPHAR